MATIAGGFLIPDVARGLGTSSSVTLSATVTAGAATVCLGPGTWDRIRFATATVTTGCTVTVTVETLDANGDPSGTLFHANATCTVVIANTDDSVIKEGTFTGSFSTDGTELVALVIRVTSGSPSSCNIRGFSQGQPSANSNIFGNVLTSGVWGGRSAAVPGFALRSTADNLWYGPLWTGLATNANNSTFATGSTPDEIGNLFTLPFTAVFMGAFLRTGSATGPQDIDIVLYDADDNVLSTISVEDYIQGTTAARQAIVPMPNVECSPGDHRLTLKPTSASNQSYVDLLSRDGVAGDRVPVSRTQRTDGGAWTDDATGSFFIYGIFEQVEAPPRHKAAA